MLEPPESLKSVYYIINLLVKSLRLVNQQETIFIIIDLPPANKYCATVV